LLPALNVHSCHIAIPIRFSIIVSNTNVKTINYEWLHAMTFHSDKLINIFQEIINPRNPYNREGFLLWS
jgi:hypothetical protein